MHDTHRGETASTPEASHRSAMLAVKGAPKRLAHAPCGTRPNQTTHRDGRAGEESEMLEPKCRGDTSLYTR